MERNIKKSYRCEADTFRPRQTQNVAPCNSLTPINLDYCIKQSHMIYFGYLASYAMLTNILDPEAISTFGYNTNGENSLFFSK